jgi:glycosyltransferase involved in cell wall biosynthesis
VHEIFDPVFGFEADMASALSESATWCHERTEAFGGVHYGNALALGRWLGEERPDVVWLFNTIGLGPVGIYEAALSTAARVLVLLMDDIDIYILHSRRNLNWVPRFRRLKSRIDAISGSRKTRDQNRKIGDYRSHAVIYSGMPFPASRPQPARGRDTFSFCYFGQIEEPKGLLELVRAARVLREQRPDVSFDLHLYGTGSRRFLDRLTTEVRDAGLSAQVIMHGFVEKDVLMHRVREHDAAVLLLKDAEPFGYTPLEAAVCGLPVILTRKVGAAECVRSEYPLLVDNRDDASAVAQQMAWCLDHRDQLPRLAEQLYDDFQLRCDLDAVTLPSYLQFIEQASPNVHATSIVSLLASCRTADLYAQSRLPVERLQARTLGEPTVLGPIS